MIFHYVLLSKTLDLKEGVVQPVLSTAELQLLPLLINNVSCFFNLSTDLCSMKEIVKLPFIVIQSPRGQLQIASFHIYHLKPKDISIYKNEDRLKEENK